MTEEQFKSWLRQCGFVVRSYGTGDTEVYLTEELVQAIAEKAKELE